METNSLEDTFPRGTSEIIVIRKDNNLMNQSHLNSNIAVSQYYTPDSDPILNDFKIEHTVNDSIFQLEAEHQKTFKIYTVSLTNEEIAEKCSKFICSAIDLADVFLVALTGQDPNLKVDITEDALIHLSITTTIGSRSRTISVDIQMTEVKYGYLDISKRLFKKLQQNLHSLDKQDQQFYAVIEKLIEHNDETEAAFQKAVKEIEALKVNEAKLKVELEESKQKQTQSETQVINILARIDALEAKIQNT